MTAICNQCGHRCTEVINGFGLFTEPHPEEGEPPIEYATPCKRINPYKDDRGGIPQLYADIMLSKIDFRNYQDNGMIYRLIDGYFKAYEAAEKRGQGLYLHSRTPGSGKTMLSCALARSVMIKFHRQIRFITAADYLERVKAGFRMEQGQEDPSEIYRICPLLVLDDLGAHKTGDWQNQEIFRLIDTRAKAGGLITVITSNYAVTDLPLWPRTVDRIIAITLQIHLPEFSLRRAKAIEQSRKMTEDLLSGSGGQAAAATG